ncbi:hypothetical protein ACM66B_004983 [Microbotryomycetes sp. NB124-2]
MQASAVRRSLANITKKNADDIVFVTSLRTPVGKFRGGFKDMYPEELLSHVLKSTRERLESLGVDVQGGVVQDIHVGTVLMELGGAKSGRLASLDAGFPIESGFKAVNRQCASSLQSVTDIATSIQAGMIDCGIAAGVEHMTRDYGTRAIPVNISPYIKKSHSQDAQDCLMPMGITSENVAAEYGYTREQQDEFACASHAKAKAAQDKGLLAEEIVPMKVRWVVPADGEKAEVIEERLIEKDEGIRPQTTMESLAKLKPAFKADGTSTAGNSSQISDGASAVTLMKRSLADKLGLKPLAKWVGSAVVGVPPRVMGIGPAFAVPKLFERFGITKDDVDLWELNEAFATQSLMVIDTLGLDKSKVNPKGGAIALGHPLGATGGRLLSSLIYELRRTEQKVGVATLCMGTGAGKATLVVAETIMSAVGANGSGSAGLHSSTGAGTRRGAFIVFEGLDRSGKTTQVAKIVDKLNSQGIKAVACRFPDRTTSTGKMIDSYLAQKSDLDDRAIHLLFSANRWERAQGILKDVEQGTTVICDRYAFSGIAFSAIKGLSYEWCRAPDVGLPAPDMTLFLDLSPEVAAQRGGFGQERYETSDVQLAVRKMFKRIGDDVGQGKWTVIDAGKTMEEVEQSIAETVDRALAEKVEGPLGQLWSS